MAEQRLDLRMSQQLVMTPQLRMAIKLLQMNSLDLQSFVEQEMLENPFLLNEEGGAEVLSEAADPRAERDFESENISEDFAEDTGLDAGWDSMYDHGAAPDKSNAGGSFDHEQSDWEANAVSEQTLKDHLNQQLGLSTNDPVRKFLGQYLIDAIDESGYISLDFTAAAQQLGIDVGKLYEALALVQTFDPVGVGARTLAECLALQMKAEGTYDEVASVILANLDLLAKRDLGKLAKIAGVTSEAVQTVCERITQLTPKPGLKFGSDVSTSLVPDLIVRKTAEGKWHAELNAEAMPKILLNNTFDVKSRNKDDDAYISDKMTRAQWLLKSLEQRARTIYKVGNALLEFQAGFFDHGVEHLQPLTLRAVAERVEVHESTVSRVTNGKFMQTPIGVFELKYFFSSAIGTTGGRVEVASESVKAMMKRLVKDENPQRPYSDEKLVALLKKEGIDVARRTVAKYREAIGIPPTSQRRVRM